MILFEGLAIWAIAQLLSSFGLPRQRLLLYAWHPLAVWEFAGSGHVDAIAIAFISLALLARHRNAEGTTGLALASASLTKLFPVALLPALYKRGGWKMPLVSLVTIAFAYLPYLGVGPRGVLGPGRADRTRRRRDHTAALRARAGTGVVARPRGHRRSHPSPRGHLSQQPRARAITRCWISLVPSPISSTLASQ